MTTMDVDVEPDRAIVEHQIINRPSHVSRSVWLSFWEDVKGIVKEELKPDELGAAS